MEAKVAYNILPSLQNFTFTTITLWGRLGLKRFTSSKSHSVSFHGTVEIWIRLSQMRVHLLRHSGSLNPWGVLPSSKSMWAQPSSIQHIYIYHVVQDSLCSEAPCVLFSLTLLSSSHSQKWNSEAVHFLNSHVSASHPSSCHSNIKHQGRDILLRLLHLGDTHGMASICCFLNILRAMNIYVQMQKKNQSWQK